MQNGAGTEYKLVQLAQKGLPKCKFNTRSQYVSHSPGDVSEGHGASPGKFLVRLFNSFCWAAVVGGY